MLENGLVISHLGKGVAVESSQGETILCQTRRRLETLAVGDHVRWQANGDNQGCIEEILPRRSLLSRPARNGHQRPVAANLDRILIVIAAEPAWDCLLIDQYLVVCENLSIEAELVLNKIDLAIPHESLEQQLSVYHSLDYKIHRLSAKTGVGMDEFQHSLKNHVCMLVGQSGVGKSSLSNSLLPGKDIRVGSLSDASGHGKHTTTAAILYHLPYGGDLIDSPGVAVFGLANIDTQALAYGYREFQPFIHQCRFNNCRHMNDQGCAVQQAISDKLIHPDRYQRFLKLHEKLPKIS